MQTMALWPPSSAWCQRRLHRHRERRSTRARHRSDLASQRRWRYRSHNDQTLTRSGESLGIRYFKARTNAVTNPTKVPHNTATRTITGGELAGRASIVYLIPADTIGPLQPGSPTESPSECFDSWMEKIRRRVTCPVRLEAGRDQSGPCAACCHWACPAPVPAAQSTSFSTRRPPDRAWRRSIPAARSTPWCL
jgi:hypothetical protein